MIAAYTFIALILSLDINQGLYLTCLLWIFEGQMLKIQNKWVEISSFSLWERKPSNPMDLLNYYLKIFI